MAELRHLARRWTSTSPPSSCSKVRARPFEPPCAPLLARKIDQACVTCVPFVRAGSPVRMSRFAAASADVKARRSSLGPLSPSRHHARRWHPPAGRAREQVPRLPPLRATPDRAHRLYNLPPSQPPSSRVAGAASTRWSIICLSTRCAPGPGPKPNPAPLAHPSPRADPQGCGSLEPASADAPAPFAAALANLTRSRSRVRAGSILLKARAEEDAPHRLHRPEDPATARRRLPPHHTHSPPPLPSLTPPSPSISTPTTPSPNPPSRLSSSHPSHPRRDRARGRTWALLCFGSFFVYSIK